MERIRATPLEVPLTEAKPPTTWNSPSPSPQIPCRDVIDGIVNRVADSTFAAGDKLRKIQTGNINSYLYVILGAVVLSVIIKLRY